MKDFSRFECGNGDEHFQSDEKNKILNTSNKIWLSLIVDEQQWTDTVIQIMRNMYPTSWKMASLFCICHQPVVLDSMSGYKAYRFASQLHTGNFLWPTMLVQTSFLPLLKKEGKYSVGYPEEKIVSILVNKIYRDCTRELELDIQFIFDLAIHRGFLPSSIEYLYTNFSSSLPTLVHIALTLPIEEEIIKSITLFSMFILHKSKGNVTKSNTLIQRLLSVNLNVSSSEEWNTILTCRQACGIKKWDKKPIKSNVTVSFNNTKYYFKWKTVTIKFLKKTYCERYDERLQWMSFCFRCSVCKHPSININTFPRHLLSLLLSH